MANNIIGTVGIGAQSVKPDWNQNDPNAKDYIKNRPGGYAAAPSFEITWDGNTTGKETVVVPNSGTLVKIADEAPSIEKFTVGNSYEAIITTEIKYSDGSNETVQNQFDLHYAGDFWIGQSQSPFCMAMGVTVDSVIIEELTFTKGLWFSIANRAEMQKVITCGISTTDGGVKKFPVSSMPDEVLSRISDAQDMAETAQNTADTATSTALTAQSIAQTAQSTANTAKTTAETAQSTANTAKTKAETAQNTANRAETTAETAQSTANNIKPDWNEVDINNPKYIANKPCYYAKTEREQYHGIPYSTVLYEGTQLYWYGSYAPQSKSSPIEQGKKYRIEGDTQIYTCEGYRTANNSYRDIIGNAALVSNCIGIVDDGEGGPIPDTGEDWAYVTSRTSQTSSMFAKTKNYKASCAFYEVTETIKTLDPMFLPPIIQRVGDDVIINSSTPNSTKKFKITVDDAGTISATEVTT